MLRAPSSNRNPQAARGYSHDHRSDCKQVCIGLVCTPESLPLSFEIFNGNRTDVTTVQEIVRSMEEKYDQSERVWVMDRGMVSEAKLIPHPDGKGEEPYIICRSTARADKERTMLSRQMDALTTELAKIDKALQKRPEPDIEKVSRRIGRWLGKYPAGAKVLEVKLIRNAAGKQSQRERSASRAPSPSQIPYRSGRVKCSAEKSASAAARPRPCEM